MTGLVRGTPCNAKTRAGGRCRKLVRGGGPCRSHGGNARHLKAARERRLAYAEALARDPRRTHAEVLDDIAHESDWLLRKARTEVRDEAPSAETMGKLVGLAERAGQWARIGLDAGTTERQTRVVEAQAGMLAAVVQRILDRLVLTPEQRDLVPVIVPEELERMSPAALGGGSDG